MTASQAWVLAVDMGYGHQRAAWPFRAIACERIINANDDTFVAEDEKKEWGKLRGAYEWVSRVSKVPVIGPAIWRTYDKLQSIHPHYPFRDLSKPTLGALRLDHMLRKGFADSVFAHMRRRAELPLLTTFYAVALAADHAGWRDVYCVVTDSDVNRIWVARDPKRSRVRYLAPVPLSRARLLQYGVREEDIFVTGFPLPQANVDAVEMDLALRLRTLDPRGNFRKKYHELLEPELEPAGDVPPRPLTITFAIGGAGAQAEIARDMLGSIAPRVREGSMRVNLVAGVRQEVHDMLHRFVSEHGLAAELGHGVRILFVPTKDEYFEEFNLLLRETDVLWTKPSELTFYAALGLPVVMAPPIGAHEERNRGLLLRSSAGQDQEDPRATAEWLADWMANGLLAHRAFNGYMHLPRHGTENIRKLMFAEDRAKVEMRM
jgi:hypothetical protein